MQYRREIDGLRAVAVLPVILFHAGIEGFAGGFVGVDVFFVISGYLITSIILADLRQDRFSLKQFYERRARRILPALLFVILACIPFAYLWMLPDELKDFSQSVVAVVLFSSNLLFFYRTGYFAADSELKPLLHTWSLGVEEQYYLLFPLLLMLLFRHREKRLFLIIAALACASFALSDWGSRHAPEANFFLAPFRAWELFAGSLCAFVASRRLPGQADGLSLIGLGLILAAIFLFDADTPFPGVAALLPVGGTALIILYGAKGTIVARTLGWAPLVGIELISYSAYLWHQPLFAFARIRSLTEPSEMLMLALAALSLLLGYASWRWVELPFRQGKRTVVTSRRSVFVLSGVGLAALLLLGLGGNATANRLWVGAGMTADTARQRMAAVVGLKPGCDEGFARLRDCRTSERPDILLWGDSFAMHLVPGLIASDPAIRLQQATLSSCSPILGLVAAGGRGSAQQARQCLAENDRVLEWLRQKPGIEVVILSSPFDAVTDRYALRDGVARQATTTEVAEQLLATVRAIRSTGARVLIVSPTAMASWDIGRCLMRSRYLGFAASSCEFSRPADSEAIRLLRAVEAEVPVYWLQDEICPTGRCMPQRGPVFLYRDKAHLSVEGSSLLGRQAHWAARWRQLAR